MRAFVIVPGSVALSASLTGTVLGRSINPLVCDKPILVQYRIVTVLLRARRVCPDRPLWPRRARLYPPVGDLRAEALLAEAKFVRRRKAIGGSRVSASSVGREW